MSEQIVMRISGPDNYTHCKRRGSLCWADFLIAAGIQYGSF
jgi:hypothetical protein